MATAIPYLDRTLFGIIAAFFPDDSCYLINKNQKTQLLWAALAGKCSFRSTTISGLGNIQTRRNGLFHSWNDEPAMVFASGTQFWYDNGELHREHGLPAVMYADGQHLWYRHGQYIKTAPPLS